MKIIAIIQARMGSTRLPGKVMKKVMGRSLLEHQIIRVKQSAFIDEIVVATTTKKQDDVIVEVCEKIGISYYRGSEHDVLTRYYEAATQYKADVVIRLTSDCPVIHHDEIDKVIQCFLEKKPDYASNTITRTYPRGFDTEVFSYDVLKKVFEQAISLPHREHVTSYIYSHPEQFSLLSVTNEVNYSQYRLTVDTPEDFDLIKIVIQNLYTDISPFPFQEIINLLRENPDWADINSHVEQKKIMI
ncbi:glycosyltransferase family protein [Priestia koreensis]|uniref:glycosyltransferase family protein n=1 Tax=Priestia koreensis TaxID=284581 RepID=UPI001F56AB92|nr:glycosyltransferase family protein [Priestia koreensis]UNL84777.1 glycosyltransferase family protein [Priestia koreensis]